MANENTMDAKSATAVKKKVAKKTTAKKAPVAKKKVARKKAVAKKAATTKKVVAKKATSVRKTSTRSTSARSSVSEHERQRLIAEQAYLRAEKRGFKPGGEVEDWLESEKLVDARLRKR